MTVPPDPTPRPHRPRARLVVGIIGAILAGVLMATQSRVNGELGRALGDGYLAALISFGSGFVILCVALAVWAPGRRGYRRLMAAIRGGTTPWWFLLAGGLGAVFVLSQGLTGAVLGVALFTVAVVCGATLSSLLIDRRGIGVTPPAAVTVTRLAGALLALVAVAWAVSPHIAGDVPLWMLLLPFISGLCSGLQQGLNGQLRIAAGSALTPTFINFVVGTSVLLLVCLVRVALVGLPPGLIGNPLPGNPLLYTGGLIGTVLVASLAVLVRITGLLLLGLGATAGQLVTSLVLDVVVPIPGHVIALATVGGTALTLLAVLIAATPSRKIGGPRPVA